MAGGGCYGWRGHGELLPRNGNLHGVLKRPQPPGVLLSDSEQVTRATPPWSQEAGLGISYLLAEPERDGPLTSLGEGLQQ